MTVSQLKSLLELLGSLHWILDDKVHIQQMADTTKVGYIPMYSHVLISQNYIKKIVSVCKAHKTFNRHIQNKMELTLKNNNLPIN